MVKKQKYTWVGLIYVLADFWGEQYSKSLKCIANLTSLLYSQNKYEKTVCTCSLDVGIQVTERRLVHRGRHKGKKVTLLIMQKGKNILHPTSMAQSLLQQKPRAKQTTMCKLSLLSVGNYHVFGNSNGASYRKFFFKHCVFKHKFTGSFKDTAIYSLYIQILTLSKSKWKD